MFGTLYVTWRRVIAAERTAEAAQQTVAVAQEGQITERFTRAIEQLGSDKIAIRLGGIYALERVAQDSPDKDHRQVMQVLAAYVRENSQWDGCPGGEQSFQPIPTDIQAIWPFWDDSIPNMRNRSKDLTCTAPTSKGQAS